MSTFQFQFKSRKRLNTAQNVLRTISTELLYSDDETNSEFSISLDGASHNVIKIETNQQQSSSTDFTSDNDKTDAKCINKQFNEINKEIVQAKNEVDVTEDNKESEETSINKELKASTKRLSQFQFKPLETKIVIEEAKSITSDSLSLSSTDIDDDYGIDHNRLSSFGSREDDVQSRLSYIVKEKLHEFAKDIRRRTSQIRDEVIREPTPDNDSETVSGTIDGGLRERASLMSLIGLRQIPTTEGADKKGEWFPPIDPFGGKYKIWLMFVVFALLYNAFTIPLRSTYPYQTDENVGYWLMIDYLCDIIYICDMVFVKPRLTFMRGGITIRKNSEMVKNYLKSKKFKLDLLSLLPFDLFYFITGPVSAWRIVRILKFSSFWEFFDLLDSSFSNPYIIRIAKTFSYMIYIIHCNSCIYYMLSAWQAFGQIPYKYKDQYYVNKWVYNNEGNAYVRCFYFTAAVATSTGNNPSPTNVIEYIYMTFSWMMGVFVFALLLGQIRDIVSNANKNNEEFRTTMDKALSECKRLDLPDNLTTRVRSWFLYTWEQQKTLDEKKLVDKLPLKLQTDLALSVHYQTLSKVQLFQDADRALLRDLVLKLRPVIFLPGDMICRKGDVGKEMYIVNNGILEVVGGENNEIIFAELTEGSAFGEISLLAIGGNNRRTANIRSKGYSTLFVLSKKDLNDVIKDYPDAQLLMKRKARQLLQKDVNKSKNGALEAEQAKEDLKKKCRISTDLRTPRMLQTVAQILPPKLNVSKQLNQAILKSHERLAKNSKHQLKRWSTIAVEFSDISDAEDFVPPSTYLTVNKTRSLDL